MVFQYNHFIGGVDCMDQNINNYEMGVRSKKWWLVFAFTVDASFHNAWQLNRKGDNNSPLDYLGFTRRIVQFYLQKYGTPPAIPGRPAATNPLEKRVLTGIRFDSANHFCYQPKGSPAALCSRKTPGRCARSAELIYTNFASKNSTRWSISRLTSDIP